MIVARVGVEVSLSGLQERCHARRGYRDGQGKRLWPKSYDAARTGISRGGLCPSCSASRPCRSRVVVAAAAPGLRRHPRRRRRQRPSPRPHPRRLQLQRRHRAFSTRLKRADRTASIFTARSRPIRRARPGRGFWRASSTTGSTRIVPNSRDAFLLSRPMSRDRAGSTAKDRTGRTWRRCCWAGRMTPERSGSLSTPTCSCCGPIGQEAAPPKTRTTMRADAALVRARSRPASTARSPRARASSTSRSAARMRRAQRCVPPWHERRRPGSSSSFRRQ